MLFDEVRELPVATVRRAPRAQLAILLGQLQRWLAARWTWLRPRMIPIAVAAVGTVGVVHAVDYLARPLATSTDADATACPVLYIDGTPHPDGLPLAELATPGYRVRLVLPAPSSP